MTKAMVLNDVRYVEMKPSRTVPTDCEQCAFHNDSVGCFMALMGNAAAAFGGDCEQRDVIYVVAAPVSHSPQALLNRAALQKGRG